MKNSKTSGPSTWTIWLAWSKSCALSALARAWERGLAALAGAMTLGALGALGVVVYWTAPWVGANAMQAYAITVFERPAASAQQWGWVMNQAKKGQACAAREAPDGSLFIHQGCALGQWDLAWLAHYQRLNDRASLPTPAAETVREWERPAAAADAARETMMKGAASGDFGADDAKSDGPDGVVVARLGQDGARGGGAVSRASAAGPHLGHRRHGFCFGGAGLRGVGSSSDQRPGAGLAEVGHGSAPRHDVAAVGGGTIGGGGTKNRHGQAKSQAMNKASDFFFDQFPNGFNILAAT